MQVLLHDAPLQEQLTNEQFVQTNPLFIETQVNKGIF